MRPLYRKRTATVEKRPLGDAVVYLNNELSRNPKEAASRWIIYAGVIKTSYGVILRNNRLILVIEESWNILVTIFNCILKKKISKMPLIWLKLPIDVKRI